MNRIRFRGFRTEEDKRSFIDKIKSHPDFKKALQIISVNDDVVDIDPRWIFHMFFYKDCIITLTSADGEINITSENITQEILCKKYNEFREREYNYKKEVEQRFINTTCRIRNEEAKLLQIYIKRFRKNKIEIRNELERLGIHVKRGTALGKLLNITYLSE